MKRAIEKARKMKQYTARGSEKMYCKNCDKLDKDILDMFDEPICTEADEVIRLRKGQGRPDWCPLKKKKAGEQE